MARKIISTITLPATLPPSGTSAADIITGYRPGFRGRIVGWQYVANVAAAGSGATRTFNLEINATDVAGTATAIALADANAVGAVKALTAPTVNAAFDADDTISVEVAAGGTAFSAGAGAFVLLVEQSARGI